MCRYAINALARGGCTLLAGTLLYSRSAGDSDEVIAQQMPPPTQYKRPPATLFTDNEADLLTVAAKDRCSTAMVANAYAFFARACMSPAPETETAIACGVVRACVTDCVNRTKEGDFYVPGSPEPPEPIDVDEDDDSVVAASPSRSSTISGEIYVKVEQVSDSEDGLEANIRFDARMDTRDTSSVELMEQGDTAASTAIAQRTSPSDASSAIAHDEEPSEFS